MKCEDFRSILARAGPVTENSSRTERVAARRHYLLCQGCRDWANALTAQLTPELRDSLGKVGQDLMRKDNDAAAGDLEML